MEFLYDKDVVLQIECHGINWWLKDKICNATCIASAALVVLKKQNIEEAIFEVPMR